MKDLYRLTIHESHALLKEKKVSSVELTRAVLKYLESVDSKIRSCMRITADHALKSAAAADRAIAEGRCSPLTGVPAIIKDNMCTRGITTTCSSKMLENFVPPYDAHVIEKLNSVNAVMAGKANMDEFAMGSSTENSAFFTTHNPWNLDCVPGGSSGGSAAAVAADACIYALGSDTGGSIRQPAGFCGVVGLKPTYGRVSRYGLVAFASSLDQIGPLAKDVTDAALIMNVISGYDRRDSTTVPLEVPDYTAALKHNIKGLRIGIPREYLVEGMQPAVRHAIETELAMQGRAMKPEHTGGQGLISAHRLQDVEDVTPFHLLHGYQFRRVAAADEHVRAVVGPDLLREILDHDLFVARQSYRMLDSVA